MHHSTMTLIAVSTETLMVVGGIVLLAGIIVTVVLRRRRTTVWQQFARDHGLRVEETEQGPRITGQVGGHNVLLEVLPDGSDGGALGVEEVRMLLKFAPPEMPRGLKVESAIGMFGQVQQALEPDRVDIGSEGFDRELLVTGVEPEAARRWLTDRRQLSLLNLVESHRDKHATLDEEGVALQTRSAVTTLKPLVNMLHALIKAAEGIQHPHHVSPEEQAAISNR